MKPKNFFAELKRRKVYTVAIAYAVGGWALAQGIAQVFPVFDIPNWVVRLVVVLIVLGFPVALILSWFFDLTRYGIVRTPDARPVQMIEPGGEADRSEKSIAVLPFADLSPSGITIILATASRKKSSLRWRKLMVCTSRQGGHHSGLRINKPSWAKSRIKLNVDHVLEGSVRRDGNRVRITAELIDASDGFTIWSETYEREMGGIFALQDEITCSIVDTLKLKLAISPPAPSRSTDAYDAYLEGLFYSDKSSEPELRKSLEFFQQALKQDPQF